MASHGETCDGCLMLGFVTRLEKAERQIDALARALILANVGVEPTSKWLDAKLAEIDAAYLASEPTS